MCGLVLVESARIVVYQSGREVSFSFQEMLNFHGGGSPGGVAHAFKVLERGLPLLDTASPIERRSIIIETAFDGPGARDAFELVTQAVSEDRFILDARLARPEHGRARERFVFRLRSGAHVVTVALRPGFVTDDFIDLTRRENRTASEERRLTAMKSEMAARVMAASASDVYEIERSDDAAMTLYPGAPYEYSSVARGLVFTAGACPLDETGRVVGPGDFESQAARTVENLRAALGERGVGPECLLKTTVFVVAQTRADLVRVWDVVSPRLGRAPSTLVGVSLLGYADQLVEIEAIAVIDPGGPPEFHTT